MTESERETSSPLTIATVTRSQVELLERYVGKLQELADMKDDLSECLESLRN